ncbi:MAG: hypothetical protein ACLUR5_05820 [Eubacterium ventriosum]
MAILSIISIIILLIFQGGFYPYAYLLVALLGGVGIIVSKNGTCIRIVAEIRLLMWICQAIKKEICKNSERLWNHNILYGASFDKS